MSDISKYGIFKWHDVYGSAFWIPTISRSNEWLRGIDIDAEYQKVVNKKSSLTASQRRIITMIWEKENGQ